MKAVQDQSQMIGCPCCWAHSSNQNLPIIDLRDQRQIRRWAEANRLRSKRNYRILAPPSWSSRPHLSHHHRWLSWVRQDCQVSVLATYIVHLKQFAHAPPELSFLHYSVRVETLRDQIRELQIGFMNWWRLMITMISCSLIGSVQSITSSNRGACNAAPSPRSRSRKL